MGAAAEGKSFFNSIKIFWTAYQPHITVCYTSFRETEWLIKAFLTNYFWQKMCGYIIRKGASYVAKELHINLSPKKSGTWQVRVIGKRSPKNEAVLPDDKCIKESPHHKGSKWFFCHHHHRHFLSPPPLTASCKPSGEPKKQKDNHNSPLR